MQPLGEALSVLFLCVRAQNLVYTFPSRIQTTTSVSYAASGCNRRSVPDLDFYVRDMVESFELEVPYVNTHDNLADILTKPMLDAKQFHKLRRIIMNDMD